MTLAIFRTIRPEDGSPIQQNPAVVRCYEAWEIAYKDHASRRNTGYSCDSIAAVAFCRAMPPLSGYQNICDFIACVGYAMLNQVISENSAGKLLYAAQIALGTVSRKPNTQSPDGA
jgi:hypothetical protein